MLTVRPDAPGPGPDLAGTWPFIGRTDAIALVLESLRTSSRAVVLTGPAGTGKTRLLNEALRIAGRDGAAVATVTATRSASAIPFGALASLLPVDELLADSIVGVVERAARAIAARGVGRDVIVAIDDAHLLDDASATLVHQLALDGSVRLLLAVRSGEALGAPIASVASDPSTEVVELAHLARADVDDLLRRVLGGHVEEAVVHALWDATKGNPLYVREMLIAAVETGSVRRDGPLWTLVSKPDVPARLVELIDARLETVHEEGRAALELLAVAGSIGRDALEELAGTAEVSDLAHRGLVSVRRDARRQHVQIAHPLYDDALRRQLTPRRLRAVQLRLAESIERFGMRRREDRVQVTTLRLDAGARLDASLLEAAARDAYFSLDVQLSERLTRAAVATGGGPALRRMLAEILRYQGRFEEAEAILASAPLNGDDRERALTAIVRSEILFRGLGEHDRAMRLLREAMAQVTDPGLRDELTAGVATITVFAGDVRSALALARPVFDAGPSRAAAAAATPVVTALTFMGHGHEAARVAERGFEFATSLGQQETQAVVAVHVVERVLALVESGHLADAEMVARMSYEWSLAGEHRLGQAWFALLLARAAQTAGRMEEALRRYRESALAFRDLRDHGIRRWALVGIAQSSAALGRPADAASAIDELDTAPPTAVHLLEAEVLRARAWLSIARGAASDGRRLLLDAASWARARGQHGLALGALHDLVRVGHAKDAHDALLELGADVEGPLAAARVAHAIGARRRDGSLLDDASDAFASIATNLFAAEASSQAAAAHRRAGRTAHAQRSAVRAEELLARCEGARTPVLGAAATDRGIDRLTPRELEIARMAATGASSRDIAQRLDVSVRTVDNQLQRAYTKLGISGRRQLAEWFGT
jgi:DNA-binding CsgD family transcriptional regulator